MTIYGPGELMADLDRKDGILPKEEKVHWRAHVRDGEDSRKNWRKLNRHGQPEKFAPETWETKGKKPRHKDHRK